MRPATPAPSQDDSPESRPERTSGMQGKQGTQAAQPVQGTPEARPGAANPPSYQPRIQPGGARPSARSATPVGSPVPRDPVHRPGSTGSTRPAAPAARSGQGSAEHSPLYEQRYGDGRYEDAPVHNPLKSLGEKGEDLRHLASQAKGKIGAMQRPRLRRPKHPLRIVGGVVVAVLLLAIIWPVYLIQYGNSKLEHVDALSGAADTPGTTYLIVGSDKREEGSVVYDSVTEGQRADTIMLLQVPESGNPALVSLPRDSYVEIPDYTDGKLNSAYSQGGPKALVKTVENLSGLTVDHYVEVSMGGVQALVDAVGGVNLCYEHDVDDPDSGMKWTAGCADVNGTDALAFSRMRKSDPLGDIGRTARQRQVVSKVVDKAVSKSTLLSPGKQKSLVGAAADNLTTDDDSGITSLAKAGMGMRDVLGSAGLMGAPPIATMDGRVGRQSVVLLDDDALPAFFTKMRDGSLKQEDFYQPLG